MRCVRFNDKLSRDILQATVKSMAKLTKTERERYLKEILEYMPESFEEHYHQQCDSILVAILEKLGEKEIVEAYRKAQKHFWYA